jgi:hypothetical protein
MWAFRFIRGEKAQLLQKLIEDQFYARVQGHSHAGDATKICVSSMNSYTMLCV